MSPDRQGKPGEATDQREREAIREDGKHIESEIITLTHGGEIEDRKSQIKCMLITKRILTCAGRVNWPCTFW